jgi:hypothetical protein
MAELEWLAAVNLHTMWPVLEAREGSGRKLRLFACSCIRRIWDHLPTEASRSAVVVAERYADGLASRADLQMASTEAYFSTTPDAGYTPPEEEVAIGEIALSAVIQATGHSDPWECAHGACDFTLQLKGWACQEESREEAHQCQLLRDIFVNPFRPVMVDASWRTPTVVSLAQAAYDERILPSGELEPARLAVLADALEEAGASGDLLEHLRSPGPHVRGCWALDVILRAE